MTSTSIRASSDHRLSSMIECEDEWGNLYAFCFVDNMWKMVYVGRGYDNRVYRNVSNEIPYMLCKGFRSIKIGIATEKE